LTLTFSNYHLVQIWAKFCTKVMQCLPALSEICRGFGVAPEEAQTKTQVVVRVMLRVTMGLVWVQRERSELDQDKAKLRLEGNVLYEGRQNKVGL
ncbi:hypothetical protein M9458_027686, partial [Cirrhinus mrigala]